MLLLKVKILDEAHEDDLEQSVNRFLSELDERRFVDIQFQVSVSNDDQDGFEYLYSAMILYKDG